MYFAGFGYFLGSFPITPLPPPRPFPRWKIRIFLSSIFENRGVLAWQQLFSDQSVLISVEGMTAMEQFVKLVIWMSELVEAELPQAHVLEGAVSVLPRLQPVGACIAHLLRK